uniref:Uncharacterized protein n=1 Tax=Anopheles melas TaxID=34690 RepID=A0A182TFC7_9DIPT
MKEISSMRVPIFFATSCFSFAGSSRKLHTRSPSTTHRLGLMGSLRVCLIVRYAFGLSPHVCGLCVSSTFCSMNSRRYVFSGSGSTNPMPPSSVAKNVVCLLS